MEGQIIAQLAYSCALSALTALAGYFGGKLKASRQKQEDRERHDRLMETGMKAVLRRDLVDAYEDYVDHGKTLTVERKQELDGEYTVYKDLGGNGTGRQMYEAICREAKVKIID